MTTEVVRAQYLERLEGADMELWLRGTDGATGRPANEVDDLVRRLESEAVSRGQQGSSFYLPESLELNPPGCETDLVGNVDHGVNGGHITFVGCQWHRYTRGQTTFPGGAVTKSQSRPGAQSTQLFDEWREWRELGWRKYR